jgi:hypothetical protein
MTNGTDTTWNRLCKSDYQRRYYVWAASRYSRIHKTCEAVIILASGGAFATWLATQAQWIASSLSLTAAAVAAIVTAFHFADTAGRCTAQAEMWSDMMHAYERLCGSDRDAQAGPDRALLDHDFDGLFKQEQHKPSERLQRKLAAQMMRGRGFDQKTISRYQGLG